MKIKHDEFVGLNRSVDEFRRWVLSDWNSPTTRALLAEYYVRCALARFRSSTALRIWHCICVYSATNTMRVMFLVNAGHGPAPAA